MADTARPPIHERSMRFVINVLSGHHALSKLVPPALWLFDALLCVLIIWKVPYTEIDWVAYMEQVSQYIAGERDYRQIEGSTGPLVYPAAHVYIYTGLYHITDRGTNIFLAQQIFAVLYLATLALVMLCYRQAKAPPYIFPLLILSKRLHSIFVLRCFNDCFAAFFLWLTIFLFQRRAWTLGALSYSWGVGIKMSLLLALPAVAVVLFLGRGLRGSLSLVPLMVQVQVAIALPFIGTNWQGYLGRAFEFSRQFQFQWTVNWRMVGEKVFSDPTFATALLILHASTIAILAASRWLRPTGRSFLEIVDSLRKFRYPFSTEDESRISMRVTPEYVMKTILIANVAGLLFARSLHYQFYAYLAWASPYLMWRYSPFPGLEFVLWAAQEWAWNVFPSTDVSSRLVVNILLVTVALSYFNDAEDAPGNHEEKSEEIKRK